MLHRAYDQFVSIITICYLVPNRLPHFETLYLSALASLIVNMVDQRTKCWSSILTILYCQNWYFLFRKNNYKKNGNYVIVNVVNFFFCIFLKIRNRLCRSPSPILISMIKIFHQMREQRKPTKVRIHFWMYSFSNVR